MIYHILFLKGLSTFSAMILNQLLFSFEGCVHASCSHCQRIPGTQIDEDRQGTGARQNNQGSIDVFAVLNCRYNEGRADVHMLGVPG